MGQTFRSTQFVCKYCRLVGSSSSGRLSNGQNLFQIRGKHPAKLCRYQRFGFRVRFQKKSNHAFAAELHSSLPVVQWVTSGYLLALALMLPLNGWLVERIGAKRLYLICFSGFTLASALFALSWSAGSGI